MKPRLTDWIVFLYLILLGLAPTALMLGIGTRVANYVVGVFPFGLIFLALALIVLRAIFPKLSLDFGLAGGRWGTLIFLLFVIANCIFFVTRLGLTTQFTASDYLLSSGFMLVAAPAILVGAVVIYVMTALFTGAPLGPDRSKAKLRIDQSLAPLVSTNSQNEVKTK